MSDRDRYIPRVHRDTVLFREAVDFTAAKTGFSPRLVEKDYFCTVLLANLTTMQSSPLVFKGGTCLAKVYAEFYRRFHWRAFQEPRPSQRNSAQR